MDKLRARPVLVAVFAVLGFMLAVAFNSSARAHNTRGSRSADLAGVVRDMERDRTALQASLDELRGEVEGIDRRAAAAVGLQESFTKDLEEARVAAGLTDYAGPGLRVTLSDAAEVPPGEDPNSCLVHDYDLAAVVNALFVGGAEAVSVNGERVSGSTPIRCAGTTVLVNATRVGSPYVIDAVGVPADLEAALAEDVAVSLVFGEYTVRYGLQATKERLTEVTVPSYKGNVSPLFARAVSEGER